MQVTRRLGSAAETRTEVRNSLKTLHARYKRLQEPDSYTVTHVHTEEPLERVAQVRPPESPPVPPPHQVALSRTLHQLLTELQTADSNNFLVAN